jgi:hypothetical protein
VIHPLFFFGGEGVGEYLDHELIYFVVAVSNFLGFEPMKLLLLHELETNIRKFLDD